MKTVTLLFTFLLIFSLANAQEDKIEESWVRDDSVFIASYIKAYKANPLKIESYLQPDKKRRNDLGFGYSSIEGSMGKGYVTVFYHLVYFQDKLVSYRLSPQMPRDSRLTQRYKRFYSTLYRFNEKDQAVDLYINFKDVAKPLDSFTRAPSTRALAYLMTPFSGIVYGYRGGEGSTILENRAAFNFVKDKLTPEDYLMLLYSKNPATRLTAAENYYRNPERFKKYKTEIDDRIKIIYSELPETQTMNGCILTTDETKKLVDFYLKEVKNYSK
ncbi:hypothetical protein [Pontibacter mangrovi]|uniref:DUF4105 domain-containing protein n=1 Tax=Pontibacter mangrovi TaxID=2589816 RepID=A0A501W4U5_9BACT|nr:hypothetical protein [Pontibacter mangrovi]TPE44609.1 hypothetical protein FJM65_06145 [Pontibacter mangrovi]